MSLLSARGGHWTSDGTGVTVIIPPPGTVASGEVRGGAPATREFALLEPTRLVDRVDAVVLSGGSAFGLAAGDGVMGLLRERGMGLPTPAGPVPIVVGLSVFDASVAALVRPDFAEGGRRAAQAAFDGVPFEAGRVGAGTGATTGKWRERLDPSGIGMAEGRAGDASVVALAVVNAWGDVIGPDGRPLSAPPFDPAAAPAAAPFPTANTTIAVVLTDAKLDKIGCNWLAQSAHTGFARALHPAHTRYDGDAVVALATGELETPVDLEHLRAVTSEVMAAAIRSTA
ncbi:P1 family peptidase [Actinoplanes sp. Pm04-4]|uniref:P1 family peptidase n=1 Tax=Paractinoplanes pyxinae TaxID=2997416 RepID=A0ABT4B3L9_9ACTN|nr:P1 family peptidase [Actinoplanes pyxinae]MCY1141099.1 P1 family peptidase [Actinoplanes pyxinae]